MSVEYEITHNKESVDYVSGNLANMASNQTLSLANRESIERNGVAITDLISCKSSDIKSSIERNSNNISIAIEKTRGDIITSNERISGDVGLLVNQSSSDIQISQEKISSEIKQIILENSNTSGLFSKDLQLNLCKITEQLTLQASENVNKVESCLNDVKSHLEMSISKINSTIHIEALKTIQILSAQMLDCCCQLKEMMTATTNATHQLVKEIENTRIKDALQSANMEIFMKKFSKDV